MFCNFMTVEKSLFIWTNKTEKTIKSSHKSRIYLFIAQFEHLQPKSNIQDIITEININIDSH